MGDMETFIRTPDGLSLWTETFGHRQDPAILLVMGAMNQGIFWPDGFCEQLAAAGFCVIRYDHRDTGRSSVVSRLRPYNLNTLARDAVAVLEGLGVRRATVVGLSMGGFIAQLMALHHPGCVERIVLLSTSADHRPYMAGTMGWPTGLFKLPPPEKVFLDFVHQVRRHPPKTPEAMAASASQGWQITYAGPRPYPRQAVEAALQRAGARTQRPQAALNHGLAVGASAHRLKTVHGIQVPTLVIHGRYDPCLPLAHGEYLAQAIPNAEWLVLDMGHSFMWSWDDEVRQAVERFASSARASAGR